MGCDIHLYIEYRSKEPRNSYEAEWSGFGGRINPGRNYALFEKLAGVRGEASNALNPVRGYPSDAGYAANNDAYIYISEMPSEGYITAAKAKEYVEKYGCKYWKEHWVSDPDAHSHSWLLTKEFEAVLMALSKDTFDCPGLEYWAILAAMREFERRGQTSRIVFWFDN